MKKWFNLLQTKLRSQHSLMVFINQVTSAGLGFITFVYLARLLPKSEFGVWMLYLTGFGVMEMIRDGMIHQALVTKTAIASSEKHASVIGAAWWISLVTTAIFSGAVWGMGYLGEIWIKEVDLFLFFRWYPLMAWCALPLNMAQWIKHATQQYHHMSITNISVNFLFFIFLLLISAGSFSVESVVIWHVVSRLVVSLIVILIGWGRLYTLRVASRESLWEQFHFGKFSILTVLGTNLLRSADIFLIGIFLGPTSVAIYSLPSKLIETASLPLRAMTVTALPKFSQLYARSDKGALIRLFNQYLETYTLLIIPGLLLAWIFTPQLIWIVGGAAYLEGVWVFRIFLLFILFLPVDRFSGVLLDSIQKPAVNTLKVLVMAGINVLGDYWVLAVGGPLWMVALVSIANVVVGIGMAIYFLKVALEIDFRYVWQRRYFLRKDKWKGSKMVS